MTFVLAMAMTVSMCVNASAVAREPENLEETIAMGYDGLLVEEVVARGINPPSANNLWNFNSGAYVGKVTKIRTDIYTNYCFYPSSSGKLRVTTDLRRHIDANYEEHNWKIAVGAYNMDGKYVEMTKTGNLHTDSLFHEDVLDFTGLDSNTKSLRRTMRFAR